MIRSGHEEDSGKKIASSFRYAVIFEYIGCVSMFLESGPMNTRIWVTSSEGGIIQLHIACIVHQEINKTIVE